MSSFEPGRHPYSTGRSGTGVWHHLRLYLVIVVVILGTLLGSYIWRRDFATDRFAVKVSAEPNLTSLADSDAEWLLPRFRFDLTVRGTGEKLATLDAGPNTDRVTEVTVRGRRLRNAVRDGYIEGTLTYPDFNNSKLSLRPELLPTQNDTLSFELTNAQAREFLDRKLTTFFAVTDSYGRPVSNLHAVLGIPLSERRREPGVYDVSIVVEDLLDLLERDRKYTIEVTDAGPGNFSDVLELEAQWFTRDEPTRQVIQVERSPAEERAEAATATTPPADTTPPPSDTEATATPPKSPSPPPFETPTTADLHVLTSPVGASVWLGGKRQLDRTPLRVNDLDPGPVTVKVEKEGFLPQEREITLQAGERNAVSFRLKPIHVEPGHLEVFATPFGQFYVDGQLVGSNVGAVRLDVAAGRHDVRVDHPLFQSKVWEGVEVKSGQTVTLRHAFSREDAVGSLRVGVSRGWGRVFIDGKDSGKDAPCILDGVSVGQHTVTLRRNGEVVPGAEEQVVIRQGEMTEIQFNP
jgi:hypothetical protein